jgi:5-methylcytosine-specific restriction endonuclease McrA
MPIRPEMRHLYPKPSDWKVLRAAVLKRADNRCECRGECGARHAHPQYANAPAQCGIRNAILAARYVADGEERWHEHRHTSECIGEPFCSDAEAPPGTKVVLVVLTIAHRDHKPQNNELENLAAFCQRCHLRYDRDEHARTRALKAGQKELFR